jgi:hypothetical protein
MTVLLCLVHPGTYYFESFREISDSFKGVYSRSKVIQLHYFTSMKICMGRSQWPRGLGNGSAAVRLLGLRVRFPPGPWLSFVNVM